MGVYILPLANGDLHYDNQTCGLAEPAGPSSKGGWHQTQKERCEENTRRLVYMTLAELEYESQHVALHVCVTFLYASCWWMG